MVWDDISNLPFPQEILEIIKNIKWDEFEWHAFGLPIPFAKFNMAGGKKLYLVELPDGSVKVQELSDFTGNISIGGFFVDEVNVDGYNYFIQFIVTICKGEVLEIRVNNINKQPACEYRDAIKDFQANVSRVVRISESWWFKWLYRPWFLSVRFVGYVILFLLKLFKDITVWVARKLTPL